MAGQEKRLVERIESTGRFRILRQLGAGGMGVVYEAQDQERDARVALKTLRRVNPASLYRFKREFRALADVTHPNLVTLYELVSHEDEWFFTMELLQGVDILTHVRGGTARRPEDAVADGIGAATASSAGASTPGAHTGTEATADTADSAISGSSVGLRAPANLAPASLVRLRRGLRQLAEALVALHATGHLHCDIKPSNVLVTPNGRVVVLDYGVVTELAGAGVDPDRMGFAGTPAYAAPEQAASEVAPTAASDWYGVGVILYEALTGTRPYVGTGKQMLEAKKTTEAPAPKSVFADVDPALATLCSRLLRRRPADRPTGAEVLRALRDAGSEAAEPSDGTAMSAKPEAALVGRSRELAVLREAFAESQEGAGAVVRIRGRSGMGKTSLVECFLEEISASGEALVLAGRCYERESVPHEAVDGLVDTLCRFLLQLPRDKADTLMPIDVQALARAFPVLRRVEAVAEARRRSAMTAADPVELRRRAFAALRELLARIAEERPLVLFIDDLQWGDVDSVPFLVGLMEPPVPPLLMVLSYRSEEVDSSPILAALLAAQNGDASPLAGAREIPIGRLSLPQALRLAEALLEKAAAPLAPAEKIAREASGNPYFVHELVRFVASRQEIGDTGQPELAKVILSRTATLSDDAAKLLETISVAGRPLAQGIARQAAGLGENHPRAVAELRSAHLARTSGTRSRDLIETFHDRIRETVFASLGPAELRAHHLRIASSIETSERPDPEALARHYAAAEEWGAAREYAAAAADKAAAAFAFERAAGFHRLALELTEPEDAATCAELGRKLGEALVNAGRGEEAAEAFLHAAAAAEPRAALELQVRAGSELLRAGRVDEGVGVLHPALASIGFHLARSPARAASSLLLGRIYTRLRGLRFRPRSAEQVAPEMLTRIDAYHAAAAGLSMVDTVRGAHAQTRHLLAALRGGDEFRAARALSYEGGFQSIAGRQVRPRVDRILANVREIAERLDEPYLAAVQQVHASLAAYHCGEWRATVEQARQGARTFREECGTGTAWELASVQLYELWALYWLGDFRELAKQVAHSLRDARERGDRYAIVSLNTGLPSLVGLVADAPGQTRDRIAEAAAQWSHEGYHLQHYWAEFALAHCELYAGDPASASKRAEAQWRALKRAFLLRVEMVRAEMLHLRARTALAAAQRAADRGRRLSMAEKMARRLGREPMAWCKPAAQLLRAGVLLTKGSDRDTPRLLAEAEVGLHAAETHAMAAAAQRLRGEVVGGDEGRALVAESDAWMQKQGVANPLRMSRFLAPGSTVDSDA